MGKTNKKEKVTRKTKGRKKRKQEFGSVEIPNDAFTAILKLDE